MTKFVFLKFSVVNLIDMKAGKLVEIRFFAQPIECLAEV